MHRSVSLILYKTKKNETIKSIFTIDFDTSMFL